MRASLVAVVGLVALSACGSPGSVSGKVSGQGLDVKSSAFASVSNIALPSTATNGVNIGTIQGAAVILGSGKDVCAEATAKQFKHGENYLMLMVLKLGAGNGTITTGVFPVEDTSDPSTLGAKALTGFAVGRMAAENGSCTNTLSANDAGSATGGSLNLNGLTSGSSGSADGTFQLTMGPQGDAISGSFSANYCAGVEALIQSAVAKVAAGDTTFTFDSLATCS